MDKDKKETVQSP